MTIETFLVGGAVRDEILGTPSKDFDFVVTGVDTFDAFRDLLVERGFKIFQEREQFSTIRAKVPEGHELRAFARDADFVLARKDGPSSDGRRPDFTEPGTLMDDLQRRDFTVNAIARAADGPNQGVLVDPFMGANDLRAGILRFVGDPNERIREDGLRVMRGFRFQITKGLTPTTETWMALESPLAAEMLQCVAVERIAEELTKMFRFDTMASMALLAGLGKHLTDAIFRGNLHLEASLKP